MKLYCFLAVASLAVLVLGCASSRVASAHRDGWRLVWEENFDGRELNPEVWSKIPRGRAEWSKYMSPYDSLYSLRKGKLTLRGILNTSCPDDTARYLTGGIYTKGKKAFGRGRLEISAKMNDVRGSWPAIWLMPFNRRDTWPMGGEVDIMERLNADTIAYQTVHTNYTYKLGLKTDPPSHSTAPIRPGQFNTYAVEFWPDSVVFFINDKRNFAYPRIETDKPGQFPFYKDWYLMIDMQLGGDWVGKIHPADLPSEMEIDYVRFYEPAE